MRHEKREEKGCKNGNRSFLTIPEKERETPYIEKKVISQAQEVGRRGVVGWPA